MIYLEPFYWYLVLKASNFLDFLDGVEVDDIFGCATQNLQWLFSLKKSLDTQILHKLPLLYCLQDDNKFAKFSCSIIDFFL